MKLEKTVIPTSDGLFANLYRKYIINNALIAYAREKRVFEIKGKEYYISEVSKFNVTFTNIDINTDEDIIKYIEDLQGINNTDYVLVQNKKEV